MPAFSPPVSLRTQPISAAVSALRRIFAALAVGLVLLLSTAVVAPSVHDLLHDGHGDHAANDYCAVVLFATGLVLTSALAVSAPTFASANERAPAFRRIFLVSPHYLHQPERGPPCV
jgi:hypothetical protein